MDLLFHLLSFPFQSIGFVFQLLLTCVVFIIGLIIGIPVLVIGLPIMLVWEFFKGAFGVLLSVVLFFGSPFGIGTSSQPVSSPQLANQATQTEVLSYSEPASSTPEVFQEAKSSGSGRCDYPDQLDSRGYRCGNRAASRRAGGRLGGTL
jgi:hypothetical protein